VLALALACALSGPAYHALAWDAPPGGWAGVDELRFERWDGDAGAFLVEHAVSCGVFVEDGPWTCPTSVPFARVGDSVPGTLYRYRIRSCNAAGCSPGDPTEVENCMPLIMEPL
jgi:hypothetical protein